MAEFSGKPVVTQYQVPVRHDSTTHAGSQCDHDKILHALCSAVCHFADCCCIGVIREQGLHLKFILYQLSQGQNTFPWKVWCIFDISGIIISIWSTYTNTADSAGTAYGLYQCQQLIIQLVDKGFYFPMFLC